MLSYLEFLPFVTQSHLIQDYLNTSLTLFHSTLSFSQDKDQNLTYFWIGDQCQGSFSRQYTHFKLYPTLLDRPLALSLDPITLLPGEKHKLYLERPIALELHLFSHKDLLQNRSTPSKLNRIYTFPITSLKRTTYGHVQNAMLCYFWKSHHLSSPLETQPLLACLPIYLENTTKEKMTFQKLIIYKNYLQLYLFPSQMMTCALHIKLSSPRDAYIQYDYTPPLDLKEDALHVVSQLSQRAPKLFKKFRLFKRKGTGIEYGF